MTTTVLDGTLTTISANFINPYTGELLAVNGDYYINDTLVSGTAAIDDTLLGSTHDQFFSLEDGLGNLLITDFEIILMAAGDDILNLASTTNIMGDMFIQMSEGNDIVWANAGNDIIGGGIGDDILHGGPGNDDISGGADKDILTGASGNDTLDGGTEFDVAIYYGAFSNYILTNNAGTITVQDTVGTDGTDTVVNVEHLDIRERIL